MSDTAYGNSPIPPIQVGTLWQWNTSSGFPVVTGYPNNYVGGPSGWTYGPTKTGLTPTDLQNYVGVPLVYYGNPPVPVASGDLVNWIRYAEDQVEQSTSILLCQTWVASPPELYPQVAQSAGLLVNNPSGAQVRGYDYDMADAGYDFIFNRWQEEGWGVQTLRYRPVQSVTYGVSGNPSTIGLTAVKSSAMIYPLLNTYFRISPTWNVEDQDYGMIRWVPATNVQMLPLFAMQLAFMGFAEDVPGAIHLQYTAGLTPWDYGSRYSFMKEYVLAEAAIRALSAVQGTINLGQLEVQTQVDGLQYRTKFDAAGAYNGLIKQFMSRRDECKKTALEKCAGPMVIML